MTSFTEIVKRRCDGVVFAERYRQHDLGGLGVELPAGLPEVSKAASAPEGDRPFAARTSIASSSKDRVRSKTPGRGCCSRRLLRRLSPGRHGGPVQLPILSTRQWLGEMPGQMVPFAPAVNRAGKRWWPHETTAERSSSWGRRSPPSHRHRRSHRRSHRHRHCHRHRCRTRRGHRWGDRRPVGRTSLGRWIRTRAVLVVPQVPACPVRADPVDRAGRVGRRDREGRRGSGGCWPVSLCCVWFWWRGCFCGLRTRKSVRSPLRCRLRRCRPRRRFRLRSRPAPGLRRCRPVPVPRGHPVPFLRALRSLKWACWGCWAGRCRTRGWMRGPSGADCGQGNWETSCATTTGSNSTWIRQ
ncbi:hypothetical protein EV138_2645 [Kribbella voronezhensis]|uniref:Uncharacterized protein n=1 Tax=Kribbella voronezhensis TaxID=2512212 RepID=A0A4R7TAM5_9ACTN|nr:hypothetical protein EV138_2645 [Kribbella voronezhensis]